MRPLALAAGAAVAAGAGVTFYAGQSPTAQLYGPVLCRVPGALGRLALTYDDGPNPAFTPALLDLLDRFGAKATFFLIGRWAEREPALVRELVDRGHAIGNHTWGHPTMPLHRDETIREELRRCRAAIESAGVELSRACDGALMRPPYGRRRPGTLRVLREEGYQPVTWSVPGYDWRSGETAQQIGRRVVGAKGGDIILLHDGNNVDPAADRSRSLEATRIALEHHTTQGARFLTVPGLVGTSSGTDHPMADQRSSGSC